MRHEIAAGHYWQGVDRCAERSGYTVTRQSGSHIRLTTEVNGTHHLTVPDHRPLKVGTLSSILRDVAQHHSMERDQLIAQLF